MVPELKESLEADDEEIETEEYQTEGEIEDTKEAKN